MILLPVFDPTNPSTGEFNLQLTGGRGKAVIYNESNSNLKLTFSNNYTSYLPAWTAVMYCFTSIPLTNPMVNYETVSVLQGVVNTTISQIAIEIYDVNEPVGGTFPSALVRQTTIGNSVGSIVSTTSVTNDGNAATVNFVEAKQSGNTSSNVLIGNDGSMTLAQFVASVYQIVMEVVVGASPYLELGKNVTIRCLDNSGNNLSTVLGITAGGNTFLRAHATGGNIQLKDKNGNSIFEIFGSNMTMQGSDTSFNLANILGVDSSGNTFIQNHSTGQETVFYSSTGSNIGSIDNSGNVLLPNGSIGKTGIADIIDASQAADVYYKAHGGQILFQCTNGSATAGFHVPSAGTTVFQLADGGTLKDVLYVDSAHEVNLQMSSSTKIFFRDPTGVALASIDSSGNMRLKGSLTQNTTP